MYGGINSDLWIKMVIIVGSVLLLFFVFNIVVRKWLGVEKKESFSYKREPVEYPESLYKFGFY